MSPQQISFFEPKVSLFLENLEYDKTAFATNKTIFNFDLHLGDDGECALIITNMFGPQVQSFTIKIDQTGNFLADLANTTFGKNNKIILGDSMRISDVETVLESF